MMELMFNNSDTLKEYLDSLLSTSTVEIEFIKADGSTRVMQCTKDYRIVPAQTKSTEEVDTRKRIVNPNVIIVWDVEKVAWRSITLDRIKKFKTANLTFDVKIISLEEF